METTTSVPVAPTAAPSFLNRHQFLIYRLFSLSGLIPVGAYMCVHLLTNFTVLDSPATFQKQVDTIHSLGILLPLVEWTFIFLPILFHATVGWLIIAGAVPNTSAYPLSGNIRYTLQRVTGIIAFFFIMAHVIHLHHLGSHIGGGQFHAEHAASSTALAIRSALWIQIAYAIGMLSCVYHFANGLWTQGITWGIWSTRAAQRRANYFSVLVGVTLAIIGLSSLYGMIIVNVKEATQVENRMEKAHEFLTGEAELPVVSESESKK